MKYNVANTSFISDEVVNIVWNGNTSGEGQVLSVFPDNTIFVQHVNGFFQESFSVPITANSYIYGQESTVNSSFINNSLGAYIGSTIIAQNLSPEEEIYWVPVTYYDYENELNENNKTIRVLDSRYTSDVVVNLTNLLSNTK